MPFPVSHAHVRVHVAMVHARTLWQVVMLNALIAIMGDTYSRVSETRVEEGSQQRAELIVELADSMSEAQKLNPAYFPRWIHAIKRMDMDAGSEGWAGQVGALKKSIAAVEAKIDANKAAFDAKIDAKIDELKALILDRVRA